MKEGIILGTGLIWGWIASLLGGFDAGLATLAVFMSVDYAMGVIAAGVFHKSKKSETGKLESKESFKGLFKKISCLLLVLVCFRLDVYLGSTFIRDAIVVMFITNELISVIENAGLMGIPIPSVLLNAVEVLNKKGADEARNEEGSDVR